MGASGGCRVGEVRAGTTSPMPDHKGFKLQYLVNFQKFSTLRVKTFARMRINEIIVYVLGIVGNSAMLHSQQKQNGCTCAHKTHTCKETLEEV